ncbi:MAG: dTDP-4-dehydrorhamnose reductase [Moraxellaceae bacterium]
MTVLLTGAGGQLGRALVAASGTRAVAAFVHADLDITDSEAVRLALKTTGAELVINAAAFNAVDAAETAPALSWACNREGPAVLAAACAEAGLPLLHVSTDYVFDGALARPYREDDRAAPLGVYGASKLAGEEALRQQLPRHIILRTAWLFDMQGENFLTRLLQRARSGHRLAVVEDQWGCPTPVAALAEALLTLADRYLAGQALPWGTWHFSGAPGVSRHAFAEAIMMSARAQGLIPPGPPVAALRSADWPAAAPRPADSRLDCVHSCQRLGLQQPDWRAALMQMMKETALAAGSKA